MPARIPAFRRPGSFPRYLRVAARRGRKRAGSGNRYEIGVALVWFGPGIVFGTWQDLAAAPSSTPLLNWPAATLLLLSGTALLGGVCSALGPVTASREWRAWLLSTPLDRGVLLRRRAWGVLAMLVVPGMVLGAAVAGMGGYRGSDALACVLVGVGAVIAVGGSTMRRQRRAGATAAGRGWLVGAAAAAGAAVAAEFLVVRPGTACRQGRPRPRTWLSRQRGRGRFGQLGRACAPTTREPLFGRQEFDRKVRTWLVDPSRVSPGAIFRVQHSMLGVMRSLPHTARICQHDWIRRAGLPVQQLCLNRGREDQCLFDVVATNGDPDQRSHPSELAE